jgi:hypothetical protein
MKYHVTSIFPVILLPIIEKIRENILIPGVIQKIVATA